MFRCARYIFNSDLIHPDYQSRKDAGTCCLCSFDLWFISTKVPVLADSLKVHHESPVLNLIRNTSHNKIWQLIGMILRHLFNGANTV